MSWPEAAIVIAGIAAVAYVITHINFDVKFK